MRRGPNYTEDRDDDSGLCCARVDVQTDSLIVIIEREDGMRLPMHFANLADVIAFIDDMAPPTVTLDGRRIARADLALIDDCGPTLHLH